jgi:hypothetical protein
MSAETHHRLDLADAERTVAESLIEDGRRERERLAKTPVKPEPILTNLTTVTPRTVEWIRPQRWPAGKLSLVVGDPGLGKSLVLLDAAARISTGAQWPEGASAPPGPVLILTAEDGLSDTVVPRLIALGADLSQVVALEAVRENAKERPFNLAADLAHLETAIRWLVPAAVFIDPLTAYLGKATDSHTDADVRAVLHPVAKLADTFNVAIIALMHLNKATQMRALYRVSGSVAFTAAARSVFAVIEEGETDRRLFAPLKMNLAPKPGTLAFRIVGGDVPTLAWENGSVANVDVEAALRGPGATDLGESRGEREDAKAFLREALAAGPVPVREILAEFKASGIASERTLKTAKSELGVRSGKRDFEGAWEWYLPTDGTHEGCKYPLKSCTLASFEESKAESQETARVSSKDATSSCVEGELHPSAPPGSLELVAEYPSESESGLVHRVRRDPADGSLSCSCKGFRYHDSCKHVLRAQLDEAGFDLEPVSENRQGRLPGRWARAGASNELA